MAQRRSSTQRKVAHQMLARRTFLSVCSGIEAATVAALYVDTDGAYFGVPGIDPWDEARDARLYPGPHPVVAHPPCKRWGRFYHGSPRKPHRYKLGDDAGCFAAALTAVRNWGGCLEHPAQSRAWDYFGLSTPRTGAPGWVLADNYGGWTCYVEQGFYGHFSRKPTWLYAAGIPLPEMIWGCGEQRLHPRALEKHGYAKASRIGVVAMIGGKDKERIRNATPPTFRDALIAAVRADAVSVPKPALTPLEALIGEKIEAATAMTGTHT